MPRSRILVVDDESGVLDVCAGALRRLPETQVELETQSLRAAERVERDDLDLLITDILMPGLNGIELLKRARHHDPDLAALIMTAYPTVETAVECMKLGAADYITKPFLPAEFEAAVRRLLEARRLQEENRLLRRQIERPYACGDIMGHTPGMHKVCESVQRAAATDFDVLILGETGTGKELVAHAIHQASRRKDGPFVPVDCGAIPEDLMESEFFGHERGAFTGAQARSLGLMEFANSGTFFMDEIAQMPMRLQAKLLRVLQERRIRRVGGTEEIPLDVRVLVASSLSLTEAVQLGRFRLDLYHRINVVRIELPPLRARTEDIPLLARHFLDRVAREMERAPVEITPEAVEVLTNYPWPGNVRELQNAMKRTLALSTRSVVSVDDLPDDIVALAGNTVGASGGGFFAQRERRVATFEKEYLRGLLNASQGDVAAAAREAQLPRGTFYRLLKKHALSTTEFRAPADTGEGVRPPP
jgi:DNA-binding NtrC family response regulator